MVKALASNSCFKGCITKKKKNNNKCYSKLLKTTIPTKVVGTTAKKSLFLQLLLEQPPSVLVRTFVPTLIVGTTVLGDVDGGGVKCFLLT